MIALVKLLFWHRMEWSTCLRNVELFSVSFFKRNRRLVHRQSVLPLSSHCLRHRLDAQWVL